MEKSGYYEFNHLTEVISTCEECRALGCDKKETNGIPDWCPRLLEQITYAEDCIINHPEVKRRFKILENLSHIYNYGIEHSVSVAKIGEQLLACDDSEYQGKNIKLLYIASVLHELGRSNDYSNWGDDYWHDSAIIAECLLSSISGLSTHDKYEIIEAIDRHVVDIGHTRPLMAALYFGSKLSLISNHFKRNLSLDEFGQLPEHEKQAFFTRVITFHKEERKTQSGVQLIGVLTLHYNQKCGRAYEFAPGFNPKLLAKFAKPIQGSREVAINFLGLDDFEIRLSYKSPFYSADKAPEVIVIPKEAILGK